ncbi:MAG: AAA family ATPase [Pyrinomonadaceae bacterium]
MSSINTHPFTFTVVKNQFGVPMSAIRRAFLIEDKWDDWGQFETLFKLILFDEFGTRHEPGYVKVGMFNLIGAAKASPPPNTARKAWIPDQFSQLPDTHFSLGQDESYYTVIAELSDDLRDRILEGLHDLVADSELWKRARQEEVILQSLLRSVKRRSVEGQFRRILAGGARLTPYSLKYTSPRQTGSDQPGFILSFDVIPDSNPPTNIHVLIGPNGVGKTHLLHLMTKALVGEPSVSRRAGKFSSNSDIDASAPITNLVSVSFSAFDNFELLKERRPIKEAEPEDYILYSYIGLRRVNNTGKGLGTPKTGTMLTAEFVKTAKACFQGARLKRWRRALETLEVDPIFKAANVSGLSEHAADLSRIRKPAAALFRGLSAGHKIVLLTMSRLVETVDEQTLVLLDEPEAHLHTPLL